MFLANYGDVLTDAPMDQIIDQFLGHRRRRPAARGAARRTPSTSSTSTTTAGSPGCTRSTDLPLWINGGYFVLRQEIFDYLGRGRGPGRWTRSPAGRGRQAARGPATTGSGRRWTPSRSAATSRSCTATGRARGPCGRRGRSCLQPPSVLEVPDQPGDGLQLMQPLMLDLTGRALHVVALGAHPDDIEIGCGGTLLRLAASVPELAVEFVVATGDPRAARGGPRTAPSCSCPGTTWRSGPRPSRRAPARVLGRDQGAARGGGSGSGRSTWSSRPGGDDAHQDHRTIAEIVPTVWRDHLVLGYEIPKWDGDLGRPAVYVAAQRRAPAREGRCGSARPSRRRPHGTGSTTRCSSGWLGCVAWSAARRYAEAFTAGKARAGVVAVADHRRTGVRLGQRDDVAGAPATAGLQLVDDLVDDVPRQDEHDLGTSRAKVLDRTDRHCRTPGMRRPCLAAAASTVNGSRSGPISLTPSRTAGLGRRAVAEHDPAGGPERLEIGVQRAQTLQRGVLQPGEPSRVGQPSGRFASPATSCTVTSGARSIEACARVNAQAAAEHRLVDCRRAPSGPDAPRAVGAR